MSLQDALRACIIADRVPYLEGAPGLGKSALAKRLGFAFGVKTIVVFLGQRAGNEIHGIPVVRREPLKIGGKEFTVVEQAPPRWAVEAAVSPGALIFFDELNQLSPPDFGQFMSITSERLVGDVPLPRETVGLMGAGNQPELSAGGWRIPLPARRRLVKLDMEVDVGLFCSPEGFSSNWYDPEERPLAKPKRRDDDNAELRPGELGEINKFGYVIPREDRYRKRTMLASWLHANQLAFKLPADVATMYDGWVSPATLEDAADLLAAVDLYVEKSAQGIVKRMLLSGCLGSAGATAILTYLDHLDVPDARDVLNDPMPFIASGLVLPQDKLYYFMMSLAEEQRFRSRTAKDKPGSKKALEHAQRSWDNGLQVAAHLHAQKAPVDMVCMMVGNFVSPEVKPKDCSPPAIVDKIAGALGALRTSGVSWAKLGALRPGQNA